MAQPPVMHREQPVKNDWRLLYSSCWRSPLLCDAFLGVFDFAWRSMAFDALHEVDESKLIWGYTSRESKIAWDHGREG